MVRRSAAVRRRSACGLLPARYGLVVALLGVSLGSFVHQMHQGFHTPGREVTSQVSSPFPPAFHGAELPLGHIAGAFGKHCLFMAAPLVHACHGDHYSANAHQNTIPLPNSALTLPRPARHAPELSALDSHRCRLLQLLSLPRNENEMV